MNQIPAPTEAMKEKIFAQLEVSENRITDDVNILKQWYRKQPQLPQDLDLSDGFFRSFILGTKSMELAKERFDRYFSVRNAFPAVFENRNPETFSKPEAIEQFVLSHYTKEGYSSYFIRLRTDSKPEEFNHLDVVKRHLLTSDYLIDKGICTAGWVVVYDLAATSTMHLAKFNLSHNNAAVKCFQDNYPTRVRKVILLNAPNAVVTMFNNIIKPLMKPKFAQKFIFIAQNDKTSLLEHIPSEGVPKEYGGDGPTCAELNEKWLKMLQADKEWYTSMHDRKSDEKKRLGKAKYDFSLSYGLDGTFRSLALD